MGQMTELRVHLLGSLRVEAGGGRSILVPGRPGDLLGYLALYASTGRAVSRDQVAFALWPDRSEPEARRALAGTVYRLRRLLPTSGGGVHAEGGTLALRAGWIDLEAFDAMAASADPSVREAALDLYAGDLLPSADAEWADAPRAAARDRFIGLLASLASHHEQAGEPAVALGLARRWATADPLDEAAHRAVMRLYARLDRHAAALDHFDALVTTLDAELGVPAQAETLDLARRIRSERELLGRQASGPLPFIGRTEERSRLLAALDRASGGDGTLMVVIGEAGIGKSRLLAEIEGSAAWRGWQISYGRGEQFGSPAPFAPLSLALQAAIPRARREMLEALVDPIWRAGAALLVPELAVDDASIRIPSDVGFLGHAIAEVLGGLGRLAPQLLLLDDVQWADQATWELLERLRPALAGMPVSIVVSGRSDELRNQPAARAALERWDRERVPWVELRGLAPDELEAMAIGLGRRDPDPGEIAELASASAGNPLLAAALLQSGEALTAATPVPSNLRASLDRLFEHRLAALSADALAALEAAAVIGQEFGYALWQDVASDVEDLASAAAQLERSGLLRIEGGSYGFAHDTLRSLVLWRTPSDRRRSLHAAAFGAVRRDAPDAVMALLFHAEQIDDRDAIAELSARAGDLALDSLSFDAAASHFGRALATLPDDARGARYDALLGRVRALAVLARRDEQRADLHEFDDLARSLGGTACRIEAARQLAEFHYAVGEYAAGEASVGPALQLATQANDLHAEAALLTIRGRVLREQGRLPEATEAVTSARDLYARLDDVHGSATTIELLAGIAWRTGDHPEAVRQHAEAARLFEQTGDLRLAAASLNSVGSALWSLGRYEAAREVHERSLAMARQIGDRRVESDNLDNLGGVAWVLADFQRAIRLYSGALAIRRLASDPRGVAISLLNLGDTYASMGDVDRAVARYDEALEVDQAVGVRRNRATALQGKGKALSAAGRHEEALACLRTAAEIHAEIGDRDNLADAHAALVFAHLGAGDVASAQSSADAALALLRPDDRATLRQLVHYAAWRAAKAGGDPAAAARHLALAVGAMDEFVDSLPADARARVLERVPLNRETVAARASAVKTIHVALPKQGLPLGRAVAPTERVTVAWTLEDPGDALLADAAERRRTVVTRLVAEAAAQGASATDDDLAAALGVSRRTILRDAAALAASGTTLGTRRRTRSG